MKSFQWKMKTDFGFIYLTASEKGIQRIDWKKSKAPYAESLKANEAAVRILADAVGQLDEYFSGGRTEFELPLDVHGTDFQKNVWKQLSKIPYGETCSYKEIAKRIKNEKAVRAVGSANGKNPVSIVVPCHRVIAADGTLGGYAGTLPVKRYLLELEKKKKHAE